MFLQFSFLKNYARLRVLQRSALFAPLCMNRCSTRRRFSHCFGGAVKCFCRSCNNATMNLFSLRNSKKFIRCFNQIFVLKYNLSAVFSMRRILEWESDRFLYDDATLMLKIVGQFNQILGISDLREGGTVQMGGEEVILKGKSPL